MYRGRDESADDGNRVTVGCLVFVGFGLSLAVICMLLILLWRC